MKIITIFSQILGLIVLVPALVIATLWLDARNNDGPAVVFRGGVFTSGTM